MGRRAAAARRRPAGLLGGERLPPPRRPLEGAALLGGLIDAAGAGDATGASAADAAASSGATPAPGPWQVATLVEAWPEHARARTLRLRLPEPVAYLPGQHFDVRLTAPDGYAAQRSYSVASAPGPEPEIELTVDRLADGEVSPYLHDVLEPGDGLEVRGPIGGYFVWRGGAPLLLLGGGSGVVPLMAMLRHRRRTAPELPARLVYSVRSPDELVYAGELAADDVLVTYTRRFPPGWVGRTGRLDAALVAESAFPAGPAFVCGSHPFVEATTELLEAAGYGPERILTERFGPTT